ncbi:helix-turn-helix domain-containing protein [Rhizorhabdus dicambivorans]|uniref:helix-turn-helix domain-containing protein n=1 Tax=Rhizorhabdus dicambivorans TaxID=1850238 RepID=UPI001596B6AB|nr:AraC family transcriptional regulator [Rhizorhabdus dicambivorans]
MVEVFTTEVASPDKRIDFWHEVTSETLIKHSVDPLDRSNFRGRLLRAQAGAVTVTRVICSGATVRRSVEQSAPASAERCLIFLLPFRGSAELVQDRSRFELNSRGGVLIDNMHPFTARYDAADMLLVKLPLKEMLPKLGLRDAHLPRPLAAGRLPVSLLSSLALPLLVEGNDDVAVGADEAWSIGAVIADLIALSCKMSTPTSTGGSRDGYWLRRARTIIEKRFDEPGVSPAAIAAELGITTRYLQMLFAARGETPSRYLEQVRLRSVERQLRDPKCYRNITMLAYDNGFASLDQFSRAFRRRFGSSPREYLRRLDRQS